MMSYPQRPLSAVLNLADSAEAVDPGKEYRIAGVYSFGKGLISRPTISGRETSYTALHRLSGGQIVMSKLNAWEGAIALVAEEYAGRYVSPEYPTYDVNSAEACPRYLGHLMAWPRLWNLLTPRGSMVRRKRTAPSTFLATEVPLPDLDEQRRVAAKLDSTSLRLRSYAECRSSQLQHATLALNASIAKLVDETTELAAVGDLVAAVRVPVRIVEGETYRAFGMRGFGRGSIRYPEAPASSLSKLSYFKFPEGALVLSNIKAWEGAIGITDQADTACVASNRFMFYKEKDSGRIDVRYLAAYFLTPMGLAQIGSASPGGADRNRTLSTKRFEKIVVPVPPLREQQRIARSAEIVKNIMRTSQQAESTSATAEASLLNAAFTGRL